LLIVLVSPGQAVFCSRSHGSFWSYLAYTIIQPGSLNLFWGTAVGEGAALTRRVVGILVPGALGIKEPFELLLVEGGALLGPIGNGDGVVGAALAIAGLGRLGTVAVLAMSWGTIAAWMRRVIVPLATTIDGVATLLVVTVCMLGVLHVGMPVDDGHHVRDGLGVVLEHLPP
jgi:hypothetical protein